MTGNEYRLTIASRLDEIESVCDFVAHQAELLGMDEEAVYHCRLSVEEICTNVIEHGYGYQQSGAIEVVCVADPSLFSITIIDDAPAFDPLSLPDPDPSTPLWERQGGGWGVFFVKKFMDRVVYSHKFERNHFTMEKKL